MPKTIKYVNAFSAVEIEKITGLSVEMVDYLSRAGFLVPAYGGGGRKGRIRYYSYRDLVIANVVQRLRRTGVELARLKNALRALRKDESWFINANPGRSSKPVQWLVTDGKKVLLKSEDGFLDELRPGGQRSFAFVVSMENLQREVRKKLSAEKLKHFTIENLEPIRAPQKLSKKAAKR